MKKKNFTVLFLIVFQCIFITIAASQEGPEYLKATAVSSTKIELNWEYQESCLGFEIWFKNDNNDFRQIATIGNDMARNYLLKDMKIDTEYTFKIRSYKNSGKSNFSEEALVRTPDDKPTDYSATINYPDEVLLNWFYNGDMTNGFDIWFKKENQKYKLWTKVGINKRTYTVKQLSSNTGYYFKIRAYGSNGMYSNFSYELYIFMPAKIN